MQISSSVRTNQGPGWIPTADITLTKHRQSRAPEPKMLSFFEEIRNETVYMSNDMPLAQVAPGEAM